MKRRTLSAMATAVPLLLAPMPVTAAKGRVIEPGMRWRLTLNIGDRSPVEGSVQETERPLNELREEVSPEVPESFTFEELGLSKSDSTYGLSLEYQWKWVTLFVDSTWAEATAVGVAPRDLNLGVKEIPFGGRTYEYQRIPEGTPYSGELDILTANIRAAVTPVTVNAGGTVEFVPWVLFGLFTLGGQFDVDAGPAQEVILYEFPPREYVVGGRGDGEAVALAPEIGIGGELKARTGERSRLVLQANASVFEFKGSTGDLGISSRNEKDLDLDYNAFDARLYFELPMSEGANFLIGAQYRLVEVDALSEAKDRPVDEIFELQEKFNKDIGFQIETLVLNLGFRW